MAETVKPATELEISEYLEPELTYNKIHKTLNALRILNLVVVKERASLPDVLELHPLVRQFIRRSFSVKERSTYVDAIIRVYKRFIGTHKSELTGSPELAVLKNWTENVELDVVAGAFADAFLTLAEVADPFLASPFPREFSRAARLLFEASDWSNSWSRYKGFEKVLRAHIRILSYLGDYKEVDCLLGIYEKTVPDKDIRYINFCELKCFNLWVKGNFSEALAWGKSGKELLDKSSVDTSSEIAHSFALAERDAGYPESAIDFFLSGRPLSEVLNPKELDPARSGSQYGNVGRCLHFMGQIDQALVCYQKSAVLVEKDVRNERVLNQGFIRFWIAELLFAKGQLALAQKFYRAAMVKWELVSPPKARKIKGILREMGAETKPLKGPDEKAFLNWMYGRASLTADSTT